MSPAALVATLIQFYGYMIIAYVLLSWIPAGGAVEDIRTALGRLVEPYLGLFRRFIPPLGMIDISPIVAILVLQAAGRLLVNALRF